MDATDLDDAPPHRRLLGVVGWAVYPWASLVLHLACIAGMLGCFAGFVLEAPPPFGIQTSLLWLAVFAAIRVLDALLWRLIYSRMR